MFKSEKVTKILRFCLGEGNGTMSLLGPGKVLKEMVGGGLRFGLDSGLLRSMDGNRFLG